MTSLGVKIQKLENIEFDPKWSTVGTVISDIERKEKLDSGKDIILVKFNNENHIELAAATNFLGGVCDCCPNPWFRKDVNEESINNIEFYRVTLDIKFDNDESSEESTVSSKS